MKKIVFLAIFICLLLTSIFNITTITKSVIINDNVSFEGYLFFQPEYSKHTYLINNHKQVVHKWSSNYLLSLTSYLLENGSIIRTCYGGIYSFLWGGGFTGKIEMIDWDSNLLWDFKYVNLKHCLHNDIEPLPNGNILMIAWERKTRDEAITAGCNPDLLPIFGFQLDGIIEVEPTYPKGGNIVWEWHVWDHLIQDYDSLKDNYGVVEDHPELVDINFRGITRFGHHLHTDFTHLNSIDYIEEYDQLLLSFRSLNEIWVIDHSTTTEEASGHTGGNYGKGGDILYRWGNPRVYNRGNESDQQLYAQHDPRWIVFENSSERHITLFNNGVSRPGIEYSSVEEIVVPIDENGNYHLEPGLAYGPEEPIWTYGKDEQFFYSSVLSSAQRLQNGNTLINNGITGSFFEVNPEKEIVWKYTNRFPIILPMFNSVFKVQYYSNDYPGLDNLDIS